MSPSSALKRCSRASRLHSPEPPATPLGSIRDTDVSDVESLCSAVSDMETPLTRSKRRAKPLRRVCRGDEELSDAESCSSAVSASSAGRNTRQSVRRRTLPQRSGAIQAAAKVDSVQDSCGSAVSTSSRVTRSQRKATPARSSSKRTDDSEHSSPDSCLSSVSEAHVPKSTNSRAVGPRKVTGPVPMNIDKAEECTSLTLTPVRQSSRVAARRKMSAAVEVSEPQSCDSEGFESGPTYSRASHRRRVAKTLDSDSDLTDVQSQDSSSCSKRGSSRRSLRNKSVVGKSVEPAEDTSLDDLETTVIAEDAEVTLLEEETQQDPKSDEVSMTEEKETSEQDSHSVEGAAAAAGHQQEELCEETQKEETVDLEELREKASSEPSKTEIDKSREQDAAVWLTDADQGSKDDPAVVEPDLCEEEKEIEAGPDDQQVVKCFQVSSRQERVKVDSVPEEEPEVITIQKNEVISLLLDSEDDEEDEDEDEDEELGEVSDTKEERDTPSPKRGEADMAVDGLFMIDTRPGEEVDEQYFMEKVTEEEKKTTEDKAEQEEDEEFVDEEGNDDDEETDVLYSSRNPLL